MKAESYKLIFEGRLKAGENPAAVRRRLADILRQPPETVDRLFSRAPSVIKRNLSSFDANMYKQAIEKSGALCRIEPETPAPAPPAPPPPDLSRKPVRPDDLQCPKCGFRQPSNLHECVKCGVIFDKLKNDAPDAGPEIIHAQDAEAYADEDVEYELYVQQVEKKGVISLGVGLAAAILIFFFPFWKYVFSAFITLVHEFGHAVFGWMFGYPTIPAFDFVYGGGVAIHFDRSVKLLLIYLALYGALFYVFRKNRMTQIILGVCLVIYCIFAFTPVHQILILFMGHGMELTFAGLFLYRALSGSSVINPLERPLYAFVGFFTNFRDVGFAYNLLYDPATRSRYMEGKGGLTNDFVRLAYDHFNYQLNAVFVFFFICCFIPPIIAFLFFRYKFYLFPAVNRLLRVKAARPG